MNTAKHQHRVAVALGMLVVSLCCAAAADNWISPVDMGVETNNDCGFISSLTGEPVIRRSFMPGQDNGLSLAVGDRVHSGDELEVPSGGLLEWNSGNNIVVVMGPGAKVRLGGVRNYSGPQGNPTRRLDVQLLQGEVRLQVRLNEVRPEVALIGVKGAEVLLNRGDVSVYSDQGWRAVVLAGQASARVRHGNVAGAPFAIREGGAAGGSGEEKLEDRDLAGIKSRIPFSFEAISAALPPLPPRGRTILGP